LSGTIAQTNGYDSVSKAEAATGTGRSEDAGAWSGDDLAVTQPGAVRLSFTTKSGLSLSNVEVWPYVEGVSVEWRGEGATGGIIKLADLPEDLQAMFHYDPAKAAAADAAERTRALQTASLFSRPQAPAAAVTPPSSAATPPPAYRRPPLRPPPRPRVWVNGYFKRNGIYVPGRWRTL